MIAPGAESGASQDRWSIALALGLVTTGVLALEVVLSRLLSVVTWYSVGFLVLSLAMLGLTAGGLWVHLEPQRFSPARLRAEIARACVWTALAVPVATVGALAIPVPLVPKLTTVAAALVLSALLALPFAAAGVVIAAALSYTPGRVGVLYAIDLVGSAAGCLLAFPLLDAFDAPSAMVVSAALPATGAVFVATRASWRWGALGLAIALAALGALNSTLEDGLRITYVKGFPETTRPIFERWNTFSRIGVDPVAPRLPFYWGPSKRAPREPVVWAPMRIDGDAGTPLLVSAAERDLEHVRWDVTSFGHHLASRGQACVIGVGGGRDIAAALSFGHRRALGIELNPIFVELLRNPPVAAPSTLAGDPRTELVVDEGRSYLARATDLRCNILVLSLVDTWAATGAGSMVLGENALYTREAFGLMLRRLTPDGILSVSRWYSPRHSDETLRLVALGVSALMESGAREPGRHVVLVGSGAVATLLVSRRALGEADVARVKELTDESGFRLLLAPGRPPATEMLGRVVAVRSVEELATVAADAPFDITPPTDDRPFFFHVIRLGDWLRPARILELADSPGMVKGNTIAILALLVLGAVVAILAALAVWLPLRALARREQSAPPRAVRRAGGAFFVLTGGGFMLVEIALVQRLGVFLGHPTLSLGVVLFGVILSTGLGAALSELFASRRRRGLLPLVAAAVALSTAPLMAVTTSAFASADSTGRIALSIAHVSAVGLSLGLQLPTGIAAIRRVAPTIAAWCWGVSGAAGVLGSVMALVISLHGGIGATMIVGGVAYALAAWPLTVLVGRADAKAV